MIKKYKNSVKRKIQSYCGTTFERIPKSQMKLGKALFNHRCQLNAVQQVKKGKMTEVYSCVCMSDSTFPVIHFVNKDKNGMYVDNTLGYQYEYYDYYIIKKIDESEFHKMDDILMDTKRSLINIHSNKMINKLFKVTEENIGI